VIVKIPQKDFSSKGGVYDVKSGMFQIPSEPSGQATAISRVPTQSEQKAIDFADIKAKDTFKTELKGNIEINSKERSVPAWMQVDNDNLQTKILRLPEKEDLVIPVNEQLIVELYSK